jgi:hypothetical protein
MFLCLSQVKECLRGLFSVSALDPLCAGKGDLQCVSRGLFCSGRCMSLGKHQCSHTLCAVSLPFGMDPSPDLSVLTSVDVWGCCWRAELKNASRESGSLLLHNKVFVTIKLSVKSH